MDETIDTRKHFSVPMTVTVKVENGQEAAELVGKLAELVQRVKGVSISHPPVVGIPAEVGAVTLSDAEQASAAELGAMLDDNAADDGPTV